jgi:hypothetical protein
MRASRSIINVITSVCVGLATLSPTVLQAEPPTATRSAVTSLTLAGAATAIAAPMLATTPSPPTPNVASVEGGSLEYVAGWQQKLQEIYAYPELFLTIGAASLTLVALAELWKFIKEDAPAYYAARRALRMSDGAFAMGANVETEFNKLIPAYETSTAEFYSLSARMERMRKRLMTEIDVQGDSTSNEFRVAIRYARRHLSGLSPLEQMHQLNEDTILRAKLKKSAAGKAWLDGWDALSASRRDAQIAMDGAFKPIASLINEYSRLLEQASTGLIRNPDLRQAPTELRLEMPTQNESAEIGTVVHSHNSGFASELNDARKLPRMLRTTEKDCRINLAKLTNVRDSHKNKMFIIRIKGGLFSGGVVAAIGGYIVGNQKFREKHHADPLEIVQEKKKVQAVQDARLAAEATSPVFMADTLKDWQKTEPPTRIMSALRVTFRNEVIPKFAEDIRHIGRGKLDQALEERLKEIESTPEVLDSIVRNALGDSLAELKIADLSRLEKAMLADTSDPMQSDAKELRDQVLAYMLAASPKHIWPNLVANPTAYPINATTTMPTLVTAVRTAMEELRKQLVLEATAAKEAKAKAAAPAPATPKNPADANKTSGIPSVTEPTISAIDAPTQGAALMVDAVIGSGSPDRNNQLASSPIEVPILQGTKLNNP